MLAPPTIESHNPVLLVEECKFASPAFHVHFTISLTLMVVLLGLKKLSPTATLAVAARRVTGPGPSIQNPNTKKLSLNKRDLEFAAIITKVYSGSLGPHFNLRVLISEIDEGLAPKMGLPNLDADPPGGRTCHASARWPAQAVGKNGLPAQTLVAFPAWAARRQI